MGETVGFLEEAAGLITDLLDVQFKIPPPGKSFAEKDPRMSGPVSMRTTRRAAHDEVWPRRFDLHQGLELGQFVLHYQLEVELDSGRVVGLEALVR